MRRFSCLLAALLVASCKPSEMFGPEKQNDELAGGVIAPESGSIEATFPSGTWEDGLGNAWAMTISEDHLSGEATSGSIRSLLMTGTILGNELDYDIGFPSQTPMAHGTARLIDENHAFFITLNTDGTLNAHGLLHFNHSAQVPTGQPMDLRPQTDCAGQVTKGD